MGKNFVAMKSKNRKAGRPRCYMSPGEINYNRHRGRHLAAAREAGVHPSQVHLVKNTGKKNPRWRCHICKQQCLDFRDYKRHIFSIRHIEAMDNMSSCELIEVNSKEFEAEFVGRLQNERGSFAQNAKFIYEDMLQSTRHVKLEDTKWKNIKSYVKDAASRNLITYKGTATGLMVKFGAPVTNTIEANRTSKTSILGEDRQEKMILNQVKKAQKQIQKKKNIKNNPKINEKKTHNALIRNKVEKVVFGFAGTTKIKSNDKKRNPHKIDDNVNLININGSNEFVNECWICKGLIVKCISRSIQNGVYYKKKGKIVSIKKEKNILVAKVRMSNDHVIQIPQKKLETVIPALGRKVKIVKWKKFSKLTLVGEVGIMVRISNAENSKDSGATITIYSGPNKGMTITGVDYDFICKLQDKK